MTVDEKREFVSRHCCDNICHKCVLEGDDNDCTINISSATESELDRAIRLIKGETETDSFGTDREAAFKIAENYNAELHMKLRDMEEKMKCMHDELMKYKSVIKTLEFVYGREFCV